MFISRFWRRRLGCRLRGSWRGLFRSKTMMIGNLARVICAREGDGKTYARRHFGLYIISIRLFSRNPD